ncbi:hypothetical protein [Luteolibacter sp. Populi]|uniref:hypothetical protein n=1 Tax=Luteolibacter sp. Populi TaxID=3230487 RepID=UPI003465F8BE
MKTLLDIISNRETIPWLGIAIVLFIGVKILLKTVGDGFGNTSAPKPPRPKPRAAPLGPRGTARQNGP